MARDIHPQYYTKTKVKCACGNEFLIGSTQKEIETEVCSQCHPFYTGQERGAVKGGRIEKFQAKLEKKQAYQKKSIKKARKRENSEPTKQTRVKGTGFKPEFI